MAEVVRSEALDKNNLPDMLVFCILQPTTPLKYSVFRSRPRIVGILTLTFFSFSSSETEWENRKFRGSSGMVPDLPHFRGSISATVQC
jgi:hypothetical protein